MNRLLVLIALTFACLEPTAYAQSKSPADLPWQVGPIEAHLSGNATLTVPEGYAFLDVDGTEAFNEIAQNPPTGTDQYTLASSANGWVAFFSYADSGYVRDDEEIDPDEILANIRSGTEAANKERRARGWGEMDILGWSAKPEYDTQIKSLTWSILGEDKSTGEKVVNYNARLLGRRGVMSVVVVTEPEGLHSAIADFKSVVPGFRFASGDTYAEYRPGDQVATYGLAALITGGAAAVAAKKGLLGVIGGFLAVAWKFVLAGLIAIGAWFKSFLKRKQ